VQQEFDAYLKCGRLEEGFLRVRCEQCHAEKLVAFSCKKRGFCPSCGGRRMAETAALLADEVLPERPLRQWVLSLPRIERVAEWAACGRRGTLAWRPVNGRGQASNVRILLRNQWPRPNGHQW
jgi:ribosomal protein S27E